MFFFDLMYQMLIFIRCRMLTKMIRTEGALLGKLEFDDQPIKIENPMERNLIDEVCRRCLFRES